MTDTKRCSKARAREFDGTVASENYKTLFQEETAAAKYRFILLTLFFRGKGGLYIKRV